MNRTLVEPTRLRLAMDCKGMSPAELADRLDAPLEWVQAAMRGEKQATEDQLSRLAFALGFTPSFLTDEPIRSLHVQQTSLRFDPEHAEHDAEPCRWCGRWGDPPLLCDHSMPDGGTCDRGLCAEHATEAGPDRHLCPDHTGAALA